jgi:DNA-binding response OmpR family regulator
MPMPVSTVEFAARARALLRRRDQIDNSSWIFRIRELELDLGSQEARIGGRLVRITPTEFRLLAFLARRNGHPCSRQEILRHLWHTIHVGSERVCDIYVSNLRRKLEPDPTRPEYIVTVRGVGYALAAS